MNKFITVYLSSIFAINKDGKPLSGRFNVKNIEQVPVYRAGFAPYITLGRKTYVLHHVATVNTKNIKISLRPATAGDALCLGVLASQVFLDTYAFAGITKEVATEVRDAFATEAFGNILSTNSTFITVAVHGGALIGFSQTTIGAHQSLAPPGEQAELQRLYVQEPFTNCGVGSRLLKEHEALAAKQNATVLWLAPWVGNHRALRFYAKHDYKDFGLVFFHMGQHKVENRVYAKRISVAA